MLPLNDKNNICAFKSTQCLKKHSIMSPQNIQRKKHFKNVILQAFVTVH